MCVCVLDTNIATNYNRFLWLIHSLQKTMINELLTFHTFRHKWYWIRWFFSLYVCAMQMPNTKTKFFFDKYTQIFYSYSVTHMPHIHIFQNLFEQNLNREHLCTVHVLYSWIVEMQTKRVNTLQMCWVNDICLVIIVQLLLLETRRIISGVERDRTTTIIRIII